MFISNGSSGMATLLQQKNCMKTLVNGGVSSGGTTASTSTGPLSTTNGANNLISTNPGTTAIQQTRMLLPHEMIGNVSVNNNRVYHHTNFSNLSQGGAFGFNGYQSTQQQQQLPINNITNLNNNNFHQNSQNQNQNMFGNNSLQYPTSSGNIGSGVGVGVGVVGGGGGGGSGGSGGASSVSSGAGINTTGTQQTRYFSQFSNNQNTTNNIAYSNLNNRINSSTLYVPNNNHHGTTSVPTANSSNNIHKRDADGANIFRGHNLPPNNTNNLSTTVIAAATPSSSFQQQNNQNQNHNQNQYGNSSSLNLENEIKEDKNQISENCQIKEINQINSNLINDTNNKLVNGELAKFAEEQEPEPEIDIVINNVVCSFSVRCHLNLREIALNGFNVEYRRENGMVTMKLRRPYTTASIWSSGRITCTGATSEDQAKIAARRYARCLQTLGFRVRFHNFRVVNVLGTCSMPWSIKIVNFSEKYKKDASYEPELHPGVTYKLKSPKATLKIFSTGSITVTAASVSNVQYAIEHIFPLVFEFRKKRSNEEVEILRAKQQHAANLAEQAELEESLLHSRIKRARMEKEDTCIVLPPDFDPDDLIEGPEDEDIY